MIDRIRTDLQNIPEAFVSSQTLIVTAVSFLAITWAFTQIVFPRLKKLDKIQDELAEFAAVNNDFYEDIGDITDDQESKKAKELNELFIRYENAYKRALWTTARAAIIFVVFSSLLVLLSTRNNYALGFLYLLIAALIVVGITVSYPSIDRLRSVKFLIQKIGFNPWFLWYIMKPGLFVDADLDRYWSRPPSDTVKFILKQQVFLTGWRYYLQISTNDNSNIWLAAGGIVTVNGKTHKSYSEYGIDYYQEMGRINHAKLNVPLRDNIREFKASMMIMAPAFKNEALNPFAIKDYHELQEETRGFMASGTSMDKRNINVINSIEINGAGSNFKLRFTSQTSQIISVELLKNLKTILPLGTFSLSDKNGKLLNSSATFKFRLMMLFWKLTGFYEFKKLTYGKFDITD